MDSSFQLIEPWDVLIAGLPSAGMTIRAAGRSLGRLRGFVVERTHHQIRYLVVRASGVFGRTTLVPFADPRVDIEGRAIEIDVDESQLWQLRNFSPEHLLTA